MHGPERHLKKLKELLIKQQYIAVVLFALCLQLFNLTADPDLFARLAVGRLIAELGYLPLKDPFAFTARHEIWIDHEWLSGLIFYYVYQACADGGLFILKLAMTAVTTALLLSAQAKIQPRTFSVLILNLLVVLDVSYIWASNIRSQAFTYFFLGVYFLVFTAIWKEKSSRLWSLILPACMLAWCNMHGGFVVGLGLHGLFVFSRVRKDFLFHCLVLLLSVGVTAFNPYGFIAYWEYILYAVSMHRETISEWQPLAFELSAIVSWVLIAMSCYALFSRRREHFVYLFYFAALFFALRHVRHVAILDFVIMVFLPFALEELPKVLKTQRERLHILQRSACLALAGLLPALFLTGTIPLLGGISLDRSAYPVSALDWLDRNRTGGNLLVDFNNGSFALWKLYPRFKVSLDGRYEELYPESTVKLVSDALNCSSSTWQESLSRIKPDFILTTGKQNCLQENMQRIYTDEAFQLFEN